MTNIQVLEALKPHRTPESKDWHRLSVPLVSYNKNKQPDDLFENVRKELYKRDYAGIFDLLRTGEQISIGKMYLVCAVIAAEARAWEQVKDFCKSALDNLSSG
jgi:hypothetical protein